MTNFPCGAMINVIDPMTREEQIQVKEEVQRILRSIDLKYEESLLRLRCFFPAI